MLNSRSALIPTVGLCPIYRPISELTRQLEQGILRAMDRAGAGAAKPGGPEPGNKGTMVVRQLVGSHV
jgi:hypothetical protein